MRYLLAFCILAWVGCTTPVLEIKDLSKQEPQDTIVPVVEDRDITQVIFSDALGYVKRYTISNGVKKQISPVFVEVKDFALKTDNGRVVMITDDFPYDSLLVYDLGLNQFEERYKLNSYNYDGVALEPDGDFNLWISSPADIKGFNDNSDAGLNSNSYTNLTDVVFYMNSRFALLASNNYGYRLELRYMSGNRLYYYQSLNELSCLDVSKDQNKIFALLYNSSTDQKKCEYNIATGTMDIASLNVSGKIVMDAEYHPYQDDKIFFLVRPSSGSTNLELILYDLVLDTYTTVVDFSNISNTVTKIQVI